jgi:D-3-phosphoglycerate dehydrogenase
MTSNKILVTCKQMQSELPKHLPTFSAAGYEVLAPKLQGQQFLSSELQNLMPGVVGVIAGDDELDRAFFEASPDLRCLIRWGIGMDSVDHEAAAESSVVVRNTPGVFGNEVADMAMGLMLAVARGIVAVDRGVREGGWPKYEGVTLSGKRVVIVGYGVIGRATASRCLAFGMGVSVVDPFVTTDDLSDEITLMTLEQALPIADFIILTCPLTEATRHLINAHTLNLVKRGSILVNVARGPVIEENALIEALADGTLYGAGLDVFELEPLSSHSSLRSHSNVVMGAHNASNTAQGVAKASSKAVEFLLAELSK